MSGNLGPDRIGAGVRSSALSAGANSTGRQARRRSNPASHMDSRFPQDYLAARERFRRAAAQLGCDLEAHPIAAKGPQGEELTIDVAVVAGTDPGRTLVISS